MERKINYFILFFYLKFTSGDLFPGSGEYSVYLLLSAAQQGMQEPKINK
jgi:hypothetical protein